ncbi:SGNH/GDSL hydrolase family protein [Aquisalinus flavus]|uniref:SGNH hydrolase-type esterase domain-containing protein n=1 Tax=Aquisalinus flavus TaxID=1526572 RepID=A0A8J2Y5D5_9PROT|nr:SGNH/GDSL hydrolase family protein [Aquisalinus flavus]MBD0425953.1 SGNH/GDSL hydrolase family protein [Aquisalinus flavus]UNE48454.1 SGNH/GDSL hydrolase family protein [Aquisalinus flavus]GGD11910.1 hypothetical protein GCM10011342_20900 [Aquisalinus flavus]
MIPYRTLSLSLMCSTVLGTISCVSTAEARQQQQETREDARETRTTARERWDALVTQSFRNRPKTQAHPSLDYWDYSNGLPNVLIYGDSISIDYTATVRAELDGKANVIRLPANGSDSGMIISKMKAMHTSMSDPALSDPWAMTWDVIHFNAGLHDLKYISAGKMDKQKGTQVNSIGTYTSNLREAIGYFREIAPDAALIFATTTPVPEGEPGRFVEDAARYNEAAIDVMMSADVAINDLYSFTLPHLDAWIVAPGNVHFTPAASELQGIEVARIIGHHLDSDGD